VFLCRFGSNIGVDKPLACVSLLSQNRSSPFLMCIWSVKILGQP